MTGFHVRGKKPAGVPDWSHEVAGDDLILPSLPPLSGRADCCCAAAAVRVRLPQSITRRTRAELLLCTHHYRVHRRQLTRAGADAFDAKGAPLVRKARLTSDAVLVCLDD